MADQLHAGFAQADITPPLGCVMEGFNLDEPAKAVNDPLMLRTAALRQGDVEAVIVALDLLFMERAEVDRLKRAVEQRLGLTPSSVLLNFSHTHSGPRLTRWHYSGEPDPAYLDTLERALVDTVARARAAWRPVTLEVAAGEVDIGINRRRINAQGKAEWGPYPPGPTSRHLPIVLLRDEETRAIVTLLFSVGCHPTIHGQPVLSAEYPGAAVRELSARFSVDCAMFLQGAGGDTKPRAVVAENRYFRVGTVDDIEAVGRDVAVAVSRAIEQGTTAVAPRLRTAITTMRAAYAPLPSRDELTAINEDEAVIPDRRNWARDMLRRLDTQGELPTSCEIHVQGVTLSPDVRLIGLEAELGSELGDQIVSHFAKGVTFSLGYTNGVRLNLPCDRQLPEGGYGVDTTWEFGCPAVLAPGIDAAVSQAVVELEAALAR